jgi:CheY-like chemotaxis protein
VVTDTGQGIEPGFLPHVFQPFRQQDASVTRAHGGLGLGLAIVKHVIELHGGRIEARSEGLDQGASFEVRIPAAMRETRPSTRPSGTTPATPESRGPVSCPPQLLGLRLLVVEDDPDARELLCTVLRACGVIVDVAASATEGFERFREGRPELLLSDIGMPGESGYELIRWIRALPPEEGGRVPAVALTAYASAADRQRAFSAGFTGHVGKPIDPQELVTVLARQSTLRG